MIADVFENRPENVDDSFKSADQIVCAIRDAIKMSAMQNRARLLQIFGFSICAALHLACGADIDRRSLSAGANNGKSSAEISAKDDDSGLPMPSAISVADGGRGPADDASVDSDLNEAEEEPENFFGQKQFTPGITTVGVYETTVLCDAKELISLDAFSSWDREVITEIIEREPTFFPPTYSCQNLAQVNVRLLDFTEFFAGKFEPTPKGAPHIPVEKITDAIAKLGCRPADLEELLSIGAAYPSLPLEHYIVGLGSIVPLGEKRGGLYGFPERTETIMFVPEIGRSNWTYEPTPTIRIDNAEHIDYWKLGRWTFAVICDADQLPFIYDVSHGAASDSAASTGKKQPVTSQIAPTQNHVDSALSMTAIPVHTVVQPSRETGIYFANLICDFNQAVAAGEYDVVSPEVTSGNFKKRGKCKDGAMVKILLKPSRKQRGITLDSYRYPFNSAGKKCRPAGWPELLALGREHPYLQMSSEIVGMGAISVDRRKRPSNVLVLDSEGMERRLVSRPYGFYANFFSGYRRDAEVCR